MGRLAAMQAFVRVAETRSFSEAARRLNLSKSVVSRQISALECDLGVRLFNRTTRALALTEIGSAYYERVSRILADIAETEQSVGHLQAAPRGRLRVNAPMSFGILHLAPALPDFLAAYPEVDVEMAMNDRTIDLLEEGFDLAIRIGRLSDSSLVARRLAPVRIVVCAAPAYLAAHGAPQTPADLKNHDCLLYTNEDSPRDWRFTTPEGAPWAVEVKGRLAANNGDTLRVATLAGQGIARLPSFLVGQDLQAGTLVSLIPDYMQEDLAVHAVYPQARLLSPKVRAFIDFLAARFGPRPYWDLVE